MSPTVRVDGKDHALDLTKEGDRFVLRRPGRGALHIAVAATDQNRLQLWVSSEGRAPRLFDFHLVSEDGATQIWCRGRARHISHATAAATSKGSERELTPPLPATVVQVLVAPGDHVTEGQPVLVLTAMKNEMTLAPAADGIVQAVNVREGERVSPGQVLVEMTPND